MIQAINNTNNINMRGTRVLFSKHTPKSKPYEQFHFQPNLKDKNPIEEFFKRMIATIKGIISEIKPD